MACIFTDAQIPGHSLIRLLFILLFHFTCLITYCQDRKFTTDDKKAIKLYNEASQSIKERNFDEGLEKYKKAIRKAPEFTEAYLQIASIYNLLGTIDSAFSYYNRYFKISDNGNISYNTAYFLSELYFKRGYYKDASLCMDLALTKNPQMFNDAKASLISKSIDFSLENVSNQKDLEWQALPDQVNRFVTQYFPAVTIDNKTILFTKRDGGTTFHDEDIVISYNLNGNWKPAESISENINSRYNEGACAISADGRTLIFTSCERDITFGSCDLFIAIKEGDVWSRPRNLGEEINSQFWDSQPSISADGRSIYFSSDRPGGFGSRDLWVSRLENGVWGNPVNLGRSINTLWDETTPFIHVNNETLFYSSNGRIGFGGYDLFVSEYLDTIWTESKNLGPLINDFRDQLSLIITADGKSGYFTQEIMDDFGNPASKIVTIKFEGDTLVSHKSGYVTGQVRDIDTKNPLKAKIELYDLKTDEVSYSTLSDRVSGMYFFALNEGNEYGVYVSSDGYLFEDFKFVVSSNSILDPDTLNIELYPIQIGASMILENIYFELDSYKLDGKSKSELNVIESFIKENDIKILIHGHTDDIGTDQYNQKLSEARAREVYNYLISKGINGIKLSYKGHGSTQQKYLELSKKALNRRIEFEIIEIKGR